jgi:pimeloyl-ACP methyl ester carboxylesterase
LDPVLKALGATSKVLQDVVHADAQQVAQLLFTPGPDGKPQLNEAASAAGIDIGPIDGKQIGISGHSLGGGLTWSIVQAYPGRFDKLALMAPFPYMVIDSLSPETVITGKGFQPPGESLIIEGGFDILAPAPTINKDIVKPLEGLSPAPAVTKFEFPFGTHTGYQDVTGIGTVLRIPAGVLVTIPDRRAGLLSAGVGSEPQPRVEFIAGALTNTKVFTLPKPLEDAVLAATSFNAYAVYIILLGLLVGISWVTGHWADAGGWLGPLWRTLSVVTALLVPIELFEVLYYTPFVQRPQTTDMIGKFMSTDP